MPIGKLTKEKAKQWEQAVAEFEAARSHLQALAEEIRDDWQGQFDDKSEKWQEGDNGQEAQAIIEALDEIVSQLEDAEITEDPLDT
jgi:uncharacterized protein YukE